ncbi:MAG: protein kinase domain-containing protein, partial [Byssovorax sp.]
MAAGVDRASTPGGTSDEAWDAAEESSAGAWLRELAFAPHVEPPGEERDRTGETLGRFQITGLLGRGGMGVVHDAVDLTLRRRIALKLLPAAAIESAERRQRFLREARAAAAVSHPNIAAVFDAGEIEGAVFIAMERVEGRSLRAVMAAARAALPEAEAVRVA